MPLYLTGIGLPDWHVSVILGAWAMAPAFQWFGLTGLYLIAALLSAMGVILVPHIQPSPPTGELKSA